MILDCLFDCVCLNTAIDCDSNPVVIVGSQSLNMSFPWTSFSTNGERKLVPTKMITSVYFHNKSCIFSWYHSCQSQSPVAFVVRRNRPSFVKCWEATWEGALLRREACRCFRGQSWKWRCFRNSAFGGTIIVYCLLVLITTGMYTRSNST